MKLNICYAGKNRVVEVDYPFVALEDLREWLKGASPLLKPHQKAMINWTPLKSYNRGYNKLKEELLAELESLPASNADKQKEEK